MYVKLMIFLSVATHHKLYALCNIECMCACILLL